MIILTCQLIFDKGGERILTSVVYDDITDRFVRTAQKISPELVQDLNSNNPMIDINDVVSLDYTEYVLDDEELEEVIEMVEDGPDNEFSSQWKTIIKRAKEFIVFYKRDRKIDKIIQ
jgi:hypothetical protein